MNRPIAFLGLGSAIAWAGVLLVGQRMGMGGMPGTMGLGFIAFLGAWTLMMAAMMLPAVAPFASFYTRTFTEHRTRRLMTFGAGYFIVWAAVGIPAFAAAAMGGRLASHHANVATGVAVGVFAACGVYQLTSLKDRCLAHCRTPLGLTLRYSGLQSRLRDVRAGLHHGGFCVACCWTLMALLIAFGVMNLVAMVALSAVVIVEKTWRHGPAFARIVGALALVFAAAVLVRPALAPGLHHEQMPMTMTKDKM
jgi:predicted metal-binding membrane protein